MNQICTTIYEYASSTLATTTQSCTPKALDFYWGFVITLGLFVCFWYLGFYFSKKK